jgi:glycosyltransferase involved in cell wall biosynthesis
VHFFRRSFRRFRAVALLAVRNERHYIARCLEHLRRQGLQVCIIDNDSTDGTAEIIRQFSRNLVIRHIRHPYLGYYDWEGILRRKQQLATEVEADWFIHCDADEIPEPRPPYPTLKRAFQSVARAGYNAVNFDEFVFVPAATDESWEGRDYVQGMRHYYFFAPSELRLVRAWQDTGAPIDLVSSGGHKPQFTGQRIFPDPFILRHYIALSRDHLINKYCTRRFASCELAKGWHYNRVGLDPNRIALPELSQLKRYGFDRCWDRSDPWREHFFSTKPADTQQGIP